jgi:membrane-bound lytic murein transglycosylase D
MESLRAANDLRGSVIHPGQSLLIPASGTAATATLAALAPPREDIAAQLPERQKSAYSAPKPRVHVVRSGDTLWEVARKYGVTVPTLAAANGLSSQAGLMPGARLDIPGSGSNSARSGANGDRMTYKVRRGDTLSEIADRYDVSVRQLMSWNQIRRSTSLRAGQRLVLYVDPSRHSGG